MAKNLNSNEMPERRRQQYITDFPAVDGSVATFDKPVHKTRSTDLPIKLTDPREELANIHRPVRLSKSQEANLHCVVSIPERDALDLQHEKQLNEFREQLDQLPFKKKYSSITVPISVRYSTMATRPRSPKSKNGLNEQQVDKEKMQAGLDQTLLRIRQQLNSLSVERVAMERQMEELTNGINQVRLQCHNQYRQGKPNTSIRRARSSSSPRVNQRKMTQSVPTSPTIKVTQDECKSELPVSSPEPQSESPDPTLERKRSTSESEYSSISSFGSLGRSVSNSTRIRAFSLNSSSMSLSQGTDYDWLSSSTIPELPESPTMAKSCSPLLSAKFSSTPTLDYSANTAPRPSRRTYSTSTYMDSRSNPNVSRSKLRDYQPSQTLPKSHRNSLPETVMNKILEDEVDSRSTCDSLSQASLSQISTEEGSPRSQNSGTLILRRSSLTGQVEHISRPRYRVKNSSFHGSLRKNNTRASSYNSLNSTPDKQYRVLNTGFRYNRKKRVILPNSIETTV